MARKTPEGRFADEMAEDLRQIFPGCVLIKNDEQYLQGIPDWLLLWENHWAMLEFKESATADHQPNQDYYVELFDSMSFGAFVYPENKEDILDALQRSFQARR